MCALAAAADGAITALRLHIIHCSECWHPHCWFQHVTSSQCGRAAAASDLLHKEPSFAPHKHHRPQQTMLIDRNRRPKLTPLLSSLRPWRSKRPRPAPRPARRGFQSLYLGNAMGPGLCGRWVQRKKVLKTWMTTIEVRNWKRNRLLPAERVGTVGGPAPWSPGLLIGQG